VRVARKELTRALNLDAIEITADGVKAERAAPLTPGEAFLVDTVEHEIGSA